MAGAFRIVKYLVVAGILGLLAWLVIDRTDEQQRILIVHSYHTDLAWVNELNDGISQPKRPHNLKVRTHYMDLRNHNNCNFYKIAATDVRHTIDEWKPDAIIIFDDLAQGLVGFNLVDWDNADGKAAEHKQETEKKLLKYLIDSGCKGEERDAAYFQLDEPATDHFPTIVYGGVNYSTENYGYAFAKNVTGITERKNYAAVVEKLIALRDASPLPVDGIQFLNDQSGTAIQETEAFLQHGDWGPFKAHPPIKVSSFSDWQQAVWNANDKNLMLVIANYAAMKDDRDRRVRQKDLIKWTEKNAALPVLGLSTRFVDDGGMITIAISGTEQGRVAMGMALRAIRCKERNIALLRDCKGTEPVGAKQYTIGLNQSLVRKRGLQLPSIYEAFSRKVRMFMPIQEQVYQDELTHGEEKKN